MSALMYDAAKKHVMPAAVPVSNAYRGRRRTVARKPIGRSGARIPNEALSALDVPERPAVAGFEALCQRADAVNRTNGLAERDRAVGANERAMATFGVDQFRAGLDQAALDQR